jgi:cold shock CspA family protein
MIGKLVTWEKRNYGFISHSDGSRGRTFVHLYEIRKAGVEPRVGDTFEFDIVETDDGRMAAGNLKLLN